MFVKQFVDMLYLHRILDYLMVGLVLFMLVYQVLLVRPDIRSQFTVIDGIVLLLGLQLTLQFVRNPGSYEIYFKVLSAFLIYFMGRVYYDRILESQGALVTASYLIVYLNLGSRILHFGFSLLEVTNAGGDLYYYDTDMAFAMILGLIFITMFGKNSIFKLVTIFVTCPYMVFFSDAGIQKILLLVVYGIILIYIAELILRKPRLTGGLLAVVILVLLAVIVLIYLPVMGIMDAETVVELFRGRFLDSETMYSRYNQWAGIIAECQNNGTLAQWFGSGLISGVYDDSLYIQLFFSLGYTGIILGLLLIINLVYYVVKVEDRKTFYLMVSLLVLLLGSGVAINSMETVQMSWFPFLFAGMVVSSVRAEGRS
ncbi:MAG: hypothetical protein IJP31_10600 [Lachnospiraceae bacterium]|nr:hypothetical protein [Lachnospiraceae bacterium]